MAIYLETNDPELNPQGNFSVNPPLVAPPLIQTLVSGSMMPVDMNYRATGALVGVDPINGGFVPVSVIPIGTSGIYTLESSTNVFAGSFLASQTITTGPESIIINTSKLLHKSISIVNNGSASTSYTITASINNGNSYEISLASGSVAAGASAFYSDDIYETNVSINITTSGTINVVVNFAGVTS